MSRYFLHLLVAACLAAAGCATTDRENLLYADADQVSTLVASVETVPVDSSDDAADDPAIWVHPDAPELSLILGTDKQTGVAAYRLNGELLQFLPLGRPNNIDLRQGVDVAGQRRDIAVVSDRASNGVGVIEIDSGNLRVLANLPLTREEPYGICMGIQDRTPLVFVTFKTGEVEAYRLSLSQGNSSPGALLQPLGIYRFDSQLEGCVYRDDHATLFVGEEERGIWKLSFRDSGFAGEAVLIDEVGGSSGIVADVEGISIYAGEQQLLLVSSQGNDSYAAYELDSPHRFVRRFRVVANGDIDGAQETDGIDSTAAPLGPMFPRGVLVVQDGFNRDPSGKQNFKLVPAPVQF